MANSHTRIQRKYDNNSQRRQTSQEFRWITFEPAVVDVRGTLVATLAASVADLDPTADPTGRWAATDDRGGIADAVDPARLLEAVRRTRRTADVVVVYLHWGIQGQPQRTKIIGRMRGYHGNTVASVSLSGQPHMHAGFNLPLPGFLLTDNPNYYRFGRDGETEEAFSQRMADSLEALIQAEGPETIAAFFAEPVQGAGGAITPPRGYFEAIQAVLRRHDILFVADEVITRAEEKVAGENLVRSKLAEGMPVWEAFRTYGVI